MRIVSTSGCDDGEGMEGAGGQTAVATATAVAVGAATVATTVEAMAAVMGSSDGWSGGVCGGASKSFWGQNCVFCGTDCASVVMWH